MNSFKAMDFLSKNSSADVGRNLLWMVWSDVISIANSVLVWMFIARMHDVEELGRFTIVMGLYALFFSVCSVGLIPFLVSEISRRKDSAAQTGIAGFVGSASVFLLISGVAASC